MEKSSAAVGSLVVAGLAVTCSLSLNNFINACCNYKWPEPEDRLERVYIRFYTFMGTLIITLAAFWFVSCRVKNANIDALYKISDVG